MKKFTLLSAAAMMFIAVALFISCQKESAVVEELPAATEGVVATQGTGHYAGSIQSAYAAALAANYIKKYGDDDKASQTIAFSAKDLIAFLNGLKTKYKSDIIYVNFGVYGRGAAPVNPKDYGRLTVFFTGNNIGSASTSTRRNDGGELDTDTASGDRFLNHGGVGP